MDITKQLVLPADTLLVPTAELPEALRTRIGGGDGDVALSRSGSRSPSKLVDAAAAALLEQFRAPATVADAVIAYCRTTEHDPEQILVEAFPLLEHLMRSRYLVEAGSAESERIAPSFAPGEPLGGGEIVRCAQVTEDSEVYEVLLPGSGRAAVKILRPGLEASTFTCLDREAAALELLGGRPAPRLLGSGELEGRPYLLMEWIPGVIAPVLAGELVGRMDPDADLHLVRLSCSILRAYTQLHAKGVVHGDVHPRNILVGPDGDITVLDFGLARIQGHERFDDPPRGGLTYFYEPEAASAFLHGQKPPPPDPCGEQYAVACLVYALIASRWYIDFGASAEEMYRQITEDAPLPFERRQTEPWPDVEDVLARALSKDPARRFGSLEAFADQLEQARARTRSDPPAPADVARAGPRSTEVLKALLPRYAVDGPLLGTHALPAPVASVGYGRAGVAHALYRIACARDDPELLSLSDAWATSALRYLDDPEGFLNADLGVTSDIVGRISLLFGPPGLQVARGLTADAMGDAASQAEATGAFIALSAAGSPNLDMTIGRAGTLLGCSLLHEAATAGGLNPSAIRAYGDDTLAGVWRVLDGYDRVGETGELTYLGIAHGWAGIAYATLRWRVASGTGLPPRLPERLEQLAAVGEEIGKGLRWPVQLGPGIPVSQRAYMSGWCNGAAGFVALWTLAHQVLGDEHYASLAERAAWVAWEDPDVYPSLCCGLAGRAYGLLNLHNSGGGAEWLMRAKELATRAAAGSGMPPGLENSLYKGELGIGTLLADLDRPETARFPFFEAQALP